MIQSSFSLFETKMKSSGIPELVIQMFKHYYEMLVSGESGLISEGTIETLDHLPDAEKLDEADKQFGQKVMNSAVVIKLNGGLGTNMGLNKAKSLLTVKNRLTFLDVIVRQSLDNHVPLILMNTARTRNDSLSTINRYPEIKQEFTFDFLQNVIPKIRQDNLTPVEYMRNPSLEWNPSGHGDIYLYLYLSGMLDALLGKGYRYAFVSNADNLGAVIEPAILGYFAKNEFSLMIEAAERTESDKKGGHLAQKKAGGLILREFAQCSEADLPDFQNVDKYRYFNSNNIWLNLAIVKKELIKSNYLLPLSMIRNKKTVDPTDLESIPVYQIETAMGSAISVFEKTAAIRIPKYRFAPVKTTNELLAVRSDAYVLTKNYHLMLNPKRRSRTPPIITLDPKYYKMVGDFEKRFMVIPSLVNCERLAVEGDCYFKKKVSFNGVKHINNGGIETID